jgi:hypothetical protein
MIPTLENPPRPRATLAPSELRAIWDLRNRGEIAQSYSEFLRVSSQLGLRGDISIEEKHERLCRTGCSPADALDFLLLEPSFLRNQTRMQEAKRITDEIEQLARNRALPGTFHFSFQKGLNCIGQSDFPRAVDCFVEAKLLAATAKERIAASLNGLMAMEALGYDLGKDADDLSRQIEALTEESLKAFYRGKLDSFRARAWYRKGEWDRLNQGAARFASDDSLDYFLSWFAGLPFVEGCDKPALEERFFRRYQAQGSRWLLGYRARTLRGLLIEADLDPTLRIQDKVERFYLWAWKWLAAPDAPLLDKILLLKGDLEKSLAQTLTWEQRQMLENAYRWLGFFSQTRDSEVCASLRALAAAQGNPVASLEYERLLLDYLVARKNGQGTIAQDTLEVLKDHPARHLAGLLLPQFLDSLAAGGSAPRPLAGLSRNLASIFPKPSERISRGILVNALEGKVRVIEKNRTGNPAIVSPILSSLLLLLREKSVFPKAEMLRACFGIARYDSYIHDPKIANTLSQANRLFRPFLRFQTKNGNILAHIGAPELLYFEGYSEHSTMLSALGCHPAALLLCPATASRSSAIAPDRLEEFRETWKTRYDYQVLLNVSKATAARRLRKWVREKKVARRGIGKSSLYKMEAGLLPLLAKKRGSP